MHQITLNFHYVWKNIQNSVSRLDIFPHLFQYLILCLTHEWLRICYNTSTQFCLHFATTYQHLNKLLKVQHLRCNSWLIRIFITQCVVTSLTPIYDVNRKIISFSFLDTSKCLYFLFCFRVFEFSSFLGYSGIVLPFMLINIRGHIC